MSRWISQFLKNESPPIHRTDNTDKADKPHEERHLSVLSVPPQGTLGKNLENMLEARTDKTDKPHDGGYLSVLSVPLQGTLDKNLENMFEGRPDKPDRFTVNTNVSVLSVLPQRTLNKNLGNMSEARTDKTDKPHDGGHLSVLSVPPQEALHKFSLLDGYEERLAIAEYGGHQGTLQAQRIAYQDAFISVLNTLPYEEEQGYYDEDWLIRRIKAAQSWLVTQGLYQPE